MATRRLSTLAFVALGIVVAMALVVLVAPYANANPDGLEKVGADTGIDTAATEHAFADGPFADYGVQGVDNSTAATGLAGIVGIVATFAVGAGVVWIVRRRRRSKTCSPTPPANPAGSAAG